MIRLRFPNGERATFSPATATWTTDDEGLGLELNRQYGLRRVMLLVASVNDYVPNPEKLLADAVVSELGAEIVGEIPLPEIPKGAIP